MNKFDNEIASKYNDGLASEISLIQAKVSEIVSGFKQESSAILNDCLMAEEICIADLDSLIDSE